MTEDVRKAVARAVEMGYTQAVIRLAQVCTTRPEMGGRHGDHQEDSAR